MKENVIKQVSISMTAGRRRLAEDDIMGSKTMQVKGRWSLRAHLPKTSPPLCGAWTFKRVHLNGTLVTS